jgi:sporulation protein YlmC with PRC-barrel domain
MTEDKLPEEYKDLTFSMSEFQIKHFVVGSQHNPFRQFKQIMLELEVRYTNIEQINLDIEKNRLERNLLVEKRDMETSPAQRALYDFDIKKVDINYDNSLRSLERTKAELLYLENIDAEFRKHHDVKELVSNQEEYEHDYWIKRLATQSALELLTVGRIGVGNLEALMQMGPDNFRKALVEATKITNEVKGQVKYLDMIGDQELLQSGETKEIDFKQQ